MATSDEQRTSALAEQVRTRRRALGLRQEEVADLAGCSERFVLSLERGKTSVQLAKVLDVMRVLGLGLEIGSGNGTITVAAGGDESTR